MEPVISYGLKEVLDDLRASVKEGFAETRHLLDSKASRTDLEALTARVDTHGREIGQLKDQARADEAATNALTQNRAARADWWKWLLGLAGTVLLIMAGFGVHP